jgi:hypothetical protein
MSSNLHHCEGETPCDECGPAILEVNERPDGTLWTFNREYSSQISFCSYCGFKAIVPAEIYSLEDGVDEETYYGRA